MDMLHRDLRAREQEAAAIGDEANSRQLQVCSNPVDVLQPCLFVAPCSRYASRLNRPGSHQKRVTRHTRLGQLWNRGPPKGGGRGASPSLAETTRATSEECAGAA